MRPIVYIVTAHRWGHRDSHAYVVGAYNKKSAAIKAADIEEEWRGGKYSCEVTEWVMGLGSEGGQDSGSKDIRARQPNPHFKEVPND